MTLGPICKIGGNGKLALFEDAHVSEALVPALDDHARSESEDQPLLRQQEEVLQCVGDHDDGER